MAIAENVITSNEEYRSALASGRIVFTLFISKTCHACEGSIPIFKRVAQRYQGTVQSYLVESTHKPVLGSAEHPCSEDITGIPTLVTHIDGKVEKLLRGLGPWETQEQELETLFIQHVDLLAAKAPASPAAPPPQPR